ncbi:glycosyltransferase WbuB [Aliidiomarina shirensis]|uniref:Glycosyltransferase WbuB n=1 Tax=Aliidiomarina shirensis TaxID=1048642 RepID=A0A432WU45_9GAMM|nr:glycosyltransferase family 4 protein [Aliidiomarina shirensis]RUO37296.1 glycosyltransferase WbuB [Aliidiomarina shirensis]
MKVLYFHQHFSTPKGSSGIRSYQMAKKLVEEGHQVTMVCGSYGGGNTGLHSIFANGKRVGNVDGIDVIEFDLAYSNIDGFLKRTAIFLKFALKSIGIALRHDYDVIFATTTPLTAGIPGIFARWLRRKPFVFEVRDLWPELPKAMGVITNPLVLWGMSVLEWISYRSATRCIGLSPGIVDGIAACGVKRDRIEMIPNGCDVDIFSQNETPWRPNGVSESDFLAIFTGTHGQANGLDSVLDAAGELEKRGRNDIKIVLIGDGKLKPDLQYRASELNLSNLIFCDPVPKNQLVGLMASADVGLQVLANVPAFYYGTSPNKFFDYISAGLPVVNNYPGWLANLIGKYDLGVAVEPDNKKAFADALEFCADNRRALAEKGQNAFALAQTEFERSKLSLQWCDWVLGAMRR